MRSERRQLILWLSLGLAVALGILWQFVPLPDAKQRMNSLPLYGPGFVGRDVPLSGWEVDFFKDVNVLKRIYRVGKQTLFITALDGTRNRHAVHDPLYCFRGGGWEVAEQESLPIADGGSIALVKLKKDGKEQDALYWFSNGKTHYDKPLEYWWQATFRRLTLGASGAEPILVMVQPIDDTPLNWKEILQAFPQILGL